MPIITQTPTPEQIRELQNRFNERYEKSPPAAPFHPIDIERVRNEDVWCQRFLEMYDLDMQVCSDKLWDTCIWRQQYGANELNENNLRAEYLNDGVIFAHGHDLDGKPLLIFKTKLHVKGTKDMDEVIRVVVYWIERLQRETHMTKITVFFDMTGTGMTNMDLEFVKRIIETFKLYYPNSLNYILIFEMAWVLNAVFKIIKGLLPAKALEILKMISKKDISTYIDKSNSLSSWGGNDDYVYKFSAEQVSKKPTLAVKANGTANKTQPTNGSVPAAADSQLNSQDKKVHFANGSPVKVRQMPDFKDLYTPQDHDMLRISPSDFIIFVRGESNESTVDISCTGNYAVTYKIQTTSPEKFRVRPRCGVLAPGENISVSILLKSEHQLAEGSKDKFLVMCMALPAGVDKNSPHIVDMWKQKPSNSADVEQHRLCCIYKGGDMRNGYGRGEAADKDMAEGKSTSNVADLSKHANQLERQLKFTQILQCVTLVFLLILSGAVLYLLKLQTASDVVAGVDAATSYADPVGDCVKGGKL